MVSHRKSIEQSPFVRHFSVIADPRKEALCDHLFLDVVLIALLAVICGADGWDEIRDWGRSKEPMLRTMLALPSGIPSADTFRRVFARIRPSEFQRAFRGWVADLIEDTGVRWIAIDGKTLRGVAKHSGTGKHLHLVHAWSVGNRLLLGQIATEEKSNEITAIPELLSVLDLKGAVVTIDAMGCQREIAQKIIEGGGDYLLSVKDNQPTLHAAIREALQAAEPSAPSEACSWTARFEEGHGRVETRRVIATTTASLPVSERWDHLQTCGVIECERTQGERTSIEQRFFITSLHHHDAALLGDGARGHWSVENQLHWILDVAFREDACTVHEGYGPENLSLLRKIALAMLKADTTFKAGMQRKRKRAGWDEPYLRGLLLGGIM